MVTQKEVAKHVGVSTATVSSVLNNSRFVSEELKERVLKAVEELRYEPNALARGLKTKQTKTIGLIFSDILNPFHTAVAKGVEETAKKHKYNVIFCNTNEDPKEERLYLQVLRERRVDGIIFVPTGGNVEYIKSLMEAGALLIQIDRRLDNLDLDTILVDNLEGAYEAVKHLLKLGHTKIAIIYLPHHATSGSQRLEGYLKALKEAHLDSNPAYIKEGDFKEESGYRLTRELLSLEDHPTALFAGSNRLALGALKAIRECGLAIPKDLALLVFDDVEYYPLLTPPITAVAHPTYEIGAAAAELLIKRVKQKRHMRPKEIVIKPTLVVRGSCGEQIQDA